MQSQMTAQEIRQKFKEFFESKKHVILPSVSLVTSDEKGVTDTTLFNSAGMQPLIPYLLGKKHPSGTRLASVQKCLRTVDIDDVGDNTHATFFEMLGNWSFGDYFKKEAIEWSFEFLTSKEYGLGLDPRRLFVTVFEGDDNAPRDDESFEIWKNIFAHAGVSGERIYFMSADENWWSAGDNGPCGPDTEMFYDLTGILNDGMTKADFLVANKLQQIVEIWNDVFMEYEKHDGKVVGKLPQRNVDTGAGLERLSMIMQNTRDLFEVDLFADMMNLASKIAIEKKSQKIIADHIRTSIFVIGDGVLPSNTDRGYVLRRLLRRAIFHTEKKDISTEAVHDFVASVAVTYSQTYPEIKNKTEIIERAINEEVEKFKKTFPQGLKTLATIKKYFDENPDKDTKEEISGKDAFHLSSVLGFPIEMTIDFARENNMSVNIDEFLEEQKQHQNLSRAGAEQKFKGGLASTDEMSVRLHTATHLLHQALRDVLGEHVEQKGSNITPERLRFDFSHTQKMTDEEKSKVEKIVNEKIIAKIPVKKILLPKVQAEKTGARHLFGEKYGDEVSIYFVGDKLEDAYSKEFCGGPHVQNTSELGHFKIIKEEAVSAGVRRIKATVLV